MSIIQFMLGTILGSFFACISERQKLFLGHSQCGSCHHRLSWWELLPILSYLKNLGQCRYCRHRIPFSLLVIEGLSGLNMVFICLATDNILTQCFMILLFLFAIYDCFHYEIPWTGLIVLGILSAFIGWQSHSSFGFGLLLWLFFEAIVYFFPSKFGGGDAKLIGLLAFTMPVIQFPIFLLIASASGIFIYLIMRKDRSQAIPFIPCLYFAFVCLQFI